MSKKILVIPGHGAGDSGACGGGKTEANIVRLIASRMKAWGGANVRRTSYYRNYYSDNGITRLSKADYPIDEWVIVELHMDACDGSARGGHVIQRESSLRGREVAKKISSLLPGRSDRHVIRTGLANPNRAKSKGYEYMLVECGFIDNSHDRDYVSENMDAIAKAIIEGCGVKPRATALKKVKCPW